MVKGGYTSTKHHCPGLSGRVGNISPGNCRKVKLGRLQYCDKHEMPCRNGCFEAKHLKNQDGCATCEKTWAREAKAEREAKEKAAEDKKKDDFFSLVKGRKKEKRRAAVVQSEADSSPSSTFD